MLHNKSKRLMAVGGSLQCVINLKEEKFTLFLVNLSGTSLVKVNSTYKVCPVSAAFTQCPVDTLQTGTGKVDPAREFKCTTAARPCFCITKFLSVYNTWGYSLPIIFEIA